MSKKKTNANVAEVVVEPVVQVETVETPTVEVVPAVEAVKAQPGRPVVPGSTRQIRLAEMKARAEANGGVIKKGRPINPESARAKRIAEREAKIAAGLEIKPGRPKVIVEANDQTEPAE